MAVRRRTVHPDPETGVVPLEAIIDAAVGALTTQEMAGGVVSVIVQRDPLTGFPDEMFTTMAVVEWKDRTEARAQSERPARLTPDPEPAPEPDEDGEEAEPLFTAAQPPDISGITGPRVEPDGFDYSALEDEDVSSIPEAAR